ALVNAANSFKGAVVIVSHDPEMIGLIADRLWLVADGTVRNFEGDLEDYRKLLLETSGVKNNAKSSTKAVAKNPDGSEMTPQQAKERRRAAADIRKKLAPFRKAVSVVEKEIEKFNLKKSMLEGKMAAPDFYDASNSSAVTQAQIDMGEINKSIEALEVKWMEAQEIHDQKEQELNSL
ncbi:MAG: ABC transporter ATP-binding protein, partial [Alphaproteobacteria bacterium]